MSASAFSQRQVVGGTFLVTAAVLGVVALLQAAAIGVALLRHPSKTAAADTGARLTAGFDEAVGMPGDAFLAGGLSETSVKDPMAGFMESMEAPPAFAMATPVPSGLMSRPSGPVPRTPPGMEGRISALIEMARSSRDSGDMSAALVKLREAQAISPAHPSVLAELATVYESMGLRDKARDQWQQLLDLGEAGAGALFHLAEVKLGLADPSSDGGLGGVSGMGETGQMLPGVATLLGRDEEGLQAGASLGLLDVRQIDEEDPDALRKLKLRIGVRARENSPIDVRDVVVQVYFYDLVNGRHIVQTNADVSYQWVTLPADWDGTEGGIEVLEVGYRLPRPGAVEAGGDGKAGALEDPGEGAEPVVGEGLEAGAEAGVEEPLPLEDRKYLGYVVRVYYKGAKQDVRAEPVKLLKLYPPPETLELQ